MYKFQEWLHGYSKIGKCESHGFARTHIVLLNQHLTSINQITLIGKESMVTEESNFVTYVTIFQNMKVVVPEN